jgi:hypothetical protein
VGELDLSSAFQASMVRHRRRRRLAVSGVVAAVAVGAGALAVAAAVGDNDVVRTAGPATETSGGVAATTAAAGSSVPDSTVVASTAPPATEPVTTLAPSTTALVSPSGIVEELELRGDGLGLLRFGTPAHEVIERVSVLVGPPTADTGFRPGTAEAFHDAVPLMAECAGSHAIQRAVAFGNLELNFSGPSEQDAELVGYSIIDSSIAAGPPYDPHASWTLAAPSGLMPGAILDDLALPAVAVDAQQAVYDDGTGEIWIGHSWNDDPGRVVTIAAGDQCLAGRRWPDD